MVSSVDILGEDAGSAISERSGPTVPSDDTNEVRHHDIVELTRVQPFEAEVIAARLRDSGIEATVGGDSVYESVNFSDGVPVFVSADDVQRARALLDGDDQPD
jgi:hypothetical protein